MIDTATSQHQEIRPKIEMASGGRSTSMSNRSTSTNQTALEKLFNSSDFGKFLSREYPDSFKENNSLFLSNDLSLPGLDAMMFKSRENSLGGLYSLGGASREWPSTSTTQKHQPQPELPRSSSSTVPHTIQVTTTTSPTAVQAAPVPDVMTSRDWMAMNTLGGKQEDLDTTNYAEQHQQFQQQPAEPTSNADMNMSMPLSQLSQQTDYSSSENNTVVVKDNEQALADLPKPTGSSGRTDWDNLFLTQLNMPSPPSRSTLGDRMMSISSLMSAASNGNNNFYGTYNNSYDPYQHLKMERSSSDEEQHPQDQMDADDVETEASEASPPPAVEEAIMTTTSTPKRTNTTKKRKRAPRKKIEPKVKDYVEPTNRDVLLGRGGKSNHHPGNIKYRQQVAQLQESYKLAEDKNQKADLSQVLVDYVQQQMGGRFLQKDEHGWFEVLPIIARRKASQALREDPDPAKRTAKRQRFLKRRAALQSQQQQKKSRKN